MKVLVTGASGYIGQRVVMALIANGHEVVRATRTPMAGGGEWIPFDLRAPQLRQWPAGTGAIVHLAADTGTPGGTDGSQEVLAAEMLVEGARMAGARFVFVSSQTARADAPTAYGRTKWQIEKHVLAAGGIVVRPGQVYGGPERGLFGTLVALVRKLPCLPAFLPPPHVQPVHVDDLADVLVILATRTGGESRIYGVAAPEPVSFTRFLRAIAGSRVRRTRVFIPVPSKLIRIASQLSGGRIAVLERLSSLMALPPMQTEGDLQRLRIKLRPLAAGMTTHGRSGRRPLLQESRALLAYLLARRPPPSAVRRQVRAVETLRDGQPLGLPRWALRWPATLALLERRDAAEFNWRLDSANLLAEATPLGARRFIGWDEPTGFVRAAVGLASACLQEVTWRLVRLALAPFLRLSWKIR